MYSKKTNIKSLDIIQNKFFFFIKNEFHHIIVP